MALEKNIWKELYFLLPFQTSIHFQMILVIRKSFCLTINAITDIMRIYYTGPKNHNPGTLLLSARYRKSLIET